MSSPNRVAWLMGCCVVLGLGAAYLYWPEPPRQLNSFQQKQLEVARRNEELARQAAKKLPQALPNAAPAAVVAQGPEGKILPVRLAWQDELGEARSMDQIDGCVMAGPGIDLFWRQGDLFVMKQKGVLRRIWNAGMIDGPYGPMHRGSLSYVCFDGKFAWASVSGFSRPRLIVLDPQTEQVWEIGAEDVPRDPKGKASRKQDLRLAVAPWSPGKVVVAGWPGQTWLAMLSFDPEQGKSVKPLPEPVGLEQKRRDLLLAEQERLTPAGMWTLTDRARNGEKQVRRLLIRRSELQRLDPPAWSVDADTSRFDFAGGASLGRALELKRFAIGDDALYWLEQAPAGNPQTVLAAAKPPKLAEHVALTGVPDGLPLFQDGWLWLLGDGCFRWKPDNEGLQSIKVDVPWKFGFRKPGEQPGRNDVYYTIDRAYPSHSYGLLVTTLKQEAKAYNNPGKFFQFGLADDPRLESETSGDSNSAGPEFAADAPPGAIVSLLELMASDRADGGRPIAHLGPAIEVGDVPEDVGLPILAREIVRQSLLLAARDRLGWLTRDAALGETLPDPNRKSAVRFVLSMRFPYQAPAVFELKRLDSQGKSEPLWTEELQIYPSAEEPCQYAKLVEAAERWSREAFPRLLEQAGLPSAPAAPASGAAIPQSAEKQLEQLNFTAQFMAIEELHAAVRQGTSPALVGALIRGYANLGILMEYQWTAVHKACKARALLYGQQLAAASPGSAWSLWHRAYAEALTGIHNAAQNDLAAADKLSPAPADAAPVERPKWVDLIASFCRFDDERLSAAANDEHFGQLAKLLQFFVVETFKHSESAQELMERLLAENPECFRVHDARSWGVSLGTEHDATVEAPAMLQITLPNRLRQADSLPSGLSKSLERREQDESLIAELARTLSAVGRDEDGGELSWHMLGELIEETQFMQSWRRVHFLRNSLSVPADDYVHAVAPLIARHRYHALLDLYLTAPQPQAAAALEGELDLNEVDFEQQAEFAKMLGARWESRRTDQYLAAAKRPEKHMDDVHRDFCAWLASFEEQRGRIANPEIIARMRKLSPDSPDAVAAWIGLRGRAIEAEAPALEKKFARSQQVWRALAYAGGWDKEPRIRRLRKCIELSHDYWAYEALASIYHQDHEYDKWLAVLDEALTQPSRGLEHDRVRAQVAGHYMMHREWQKALPYALDAAQSWAGWAMIGAADCYEGLGDSENEGLWRARIAERYPSEENSLMLYFWARRTGLGDAQGLATQLDPVMADRAENATSSRQGQVGAFYQLSGRPERALAAYQTAAKDRSDLHVAYTSQLRAALIAHELDNVEARGQALKPLVSIRDPDLAAFQKIGAWLEKDLVRPKEEQADLLTARNAIAEAARSDRPSLNYAIGRYLQLRGQQQDATPVLDAAASNGESLNTLSRILASAALRADGLTPSKLKTEPIPFKKPDQKPSPPVKASAPPLD